MEQHEQEQFDLLYAQHLQALKLQGKRGKTIDGYARVPCSGVIPWASAPATPGLSARTSDTVKRH